MTVIGKVERPFIFRQSLYLADLAEEAERHYNGSEQVKWYRMLEQEYDNLEASLEWLHSKMVAQTIGISELKILYRLTAALWRFWQVRGHVTEGRRWLEAIIEGWSQQESFIQFSALRAKIYHGAGVLTSIQGELETPVGFFEESLNLRRRLDDQPGITACLNNLGILALYQAEYDRASQFLLESLTVRRQQGDRWGVCNTLTNLGNVKLAQSDFAAAKPFLEESLGVGRELGDQRSIAICLYNLANIALHEKDTQGALRLFRESVAIRQELGDKIGLAECLEGLAGLLVVSDQLPRAASLFGAAAFLRETIGAPLEPVDQPGYTHFKEQTRLTLGQTTFEENWTSGRAMPVENAFEFALAG